MGHASGGYDLFLDVFAYLKNADDFHHLKRTLIAAQSFIYLLLFSQLKLNLILLPSTNCFQMSNFPIDINVLNAHTVNANTSKICQHH